MLWVLAFALSVLGFGFLGLGFLSFGFWVLGFGVGFWVWGFCVVRFWALGCGFGFWAGEPSGGSRGNLLEGSGGTGGPGHTYRYLFRTVRTPKASLVGEISLSDIYVSFNNIAHPLDNYPSATPTRKHVDFQRGCSISMFFGFGVLDFGF